MKSSEGVRYPSLVLLKRLLSQSYSGTFYPKELQELHLTEDRVYRPLDYVTEGSSPPTQRSWGTMTGRGTPGTSPELAEPLMSCSKGCHRRATSPMGWGDTSSWVNGRHSPSTPHQSHYRFRENYCPQKHGTHSGKLERTFFGLCKICYGIFRWRSKDRRREISNWTGEEQMWKNTEESDKKTWT